MVQPEWHAYYDAKVCVLDQFSGYMGDDILKKGGSALLESELSEIIRPAVSEGSARPDVLRPSLHKGIGRKHSMLLLCQMQLCLMQSCLMSLGWQACMLHIKSDSEAVSALAACPTLCAKHHQLCVNHLGHFLLLHRLILIKASLVRFKPMHHSLDTVNLLPGTLLIC